MKRILVVLIVLGLAPVASADPDGPIAILTDPVVVTAGGEATVVMSGSGFLTRFDIEQVANGPFSIIAEGIAACTDSSCTFPDGSRPLGGMQRVRVRCNAGSGNATGVILAYGSQGDSDSADLFCQASPGPTFTVDPSMIDAGIVPLCQSFEDTVRVTNTGGMPVVITHSPALEHPDSWSISGCDLGGCNVGVGAFTDLRVRYAPMVAGQQSSRFHVTARSADGASTQPVLLTGQGVAGCQQLNVTDPASFALNFGDDVPLTGRTQTFALDLVSATTVPVAFTSSDPRITVAPASLAMPPGALTFQVTCRGDEPSVIDATITIGADVPQNTETLQVHCGIVDGGMPGEASVSLVPEAIDLGSRCVDPTVPASSTLLLTNDGDVDVVVQAPVVASPMSVVFEPALVFPYTLAPGESISATLLVPTPTASTIAETLTWVIDGVETFTVPISLTVLDSGTAISPRMVDFGPYSIDATSNAQTITFQQCAASAATIELLSLVNTQGAGDAWIVSSAPGPLTFDANGIATVQVQFAPRAPGAFRAELPFLVDGQRQSVMLFGLGNGELGERTSFYACACSGGSLAAGWPLLLALLPLRRRRLRAARARSATSR